MCPWLLPTGSQDKICLRRVDNIAFTAETTSQAIVNFLLQRLDLPTGQSCVSTTSHPLLKQLLLNQLLRCYCYRRYQQNTHVWKGARSMPCWCEEAVMNHNHSSLTSVRRKTRCFWEDLVYWWPVLNKCTHITYATKSGSTRTSKIPRQWSMTRDGMNDGAERETSQRQVCQ